MTTDVLETTSIAATLRDALGDDIVLADPVSLDYYANDVFWQPGIRPAAIVMPTTPEQAAKAIGLATQAGCAVVPRGGGMSYTKGYLPSRAGSVVIDSRGLNRVVEVNAPDMYVTAEAGCTWASVNAALEGTGLRTPYWGPLSGINATVGGALSQNSAFFGSTLNGTVAESVLGVSVVLADGSIAVTGSAGRPGVKPFTREGGPDLTGMFLGDNGAFGFKLAATIKLVAQPAAVGFASFGFATIQAMGAAQVEMARARLVSEGFGIDRTKAEHSASVNRISEGLQILGNVATSGRSLFAGVKDAIGVAAAGTGFLKAHNFTLHLVIEREDDATLARAMARVSEIGRRHGTEIDNAVPRVMRSRPFGPVRGMLGRDGERWVPIHGVFPLSESKRVLDANDAYFAGQRAFMQQHGIVYSVMTMTTGNEFFLEPAFYWTDEITDLHAKSVGEDTVRPWRNRPANPEAREAVAKLRAGTQALYASLGGVAWQVARDYPYHDLLLPGTRGLLHALKHAVDPRGLMNPGSLGLAT
jgi:D-lactate dehydrogenase (cytochrome)